MGKRVYIFIAYFILSILSASTLKAEESLRLREVLKKALAENHYIKSKGYDVISKEKDLNLSKYALYPKFYLEEKLTTGNYNSYAVFTRLNQETLTMGNFFNGGTVTNFQTSLNLEMPLYVKEVFLNRDVKKSFFLSSKNEFDSFKEEIAFETFKVYLRVVKAKALKNMAEKSLEEAKEVYRVSEVRVNKGMGVKSDELRAYVFLKERESQLIKAENDVEVAKRMLALMFSEDSLYDVYDENIEELLLPPLEEAIKQALVYRKDLISSRYNLEGLNSVLEIEKGRYYPKVFLSANYYNDGKNYPLGSDGSGYVAGIYLRWDIFDKTRGEGKEKALAETLKLKEFIKQKEKEVVFRVKESYLRVEEMKKRFEVAKEAIKEAEETFRLIKLRYENDLATIVELLDAENSLIVARNNFTIAKDDYYEAIGKSLFEAGLFIDNFVKER